MRMEHVALLVKEPLAVVRWYEEHLGFRVVRSTGAPSLTHFLADEAGSLVEIYRNDHLAVPDYASLDPLVLHLAFETADVEADRARLLAAGATPEGDVAVTPFGDRMAMLRDPWGLAIQLAQRAERMV